MIFQAQREKAGGTFPAESYPAPSPTTSLPGLYVHIPFCRRKCRYCDFFSTTDQSWRRRWLAALQTEMARQCQDPFWQEAVGKPDFDTLYLGGGTPSLLSPEELAVILAAIQAHWRLAPAAEITLEANPDDVTPELLRVWRELGINRLSLGIQSFADAELRWLGRRHDARQARQAVIWAQQAGFANLSLDLIYGLPGQELRRWRQTLAQAAAFEPAHLSCYQLTLEPGTPLGEAAARGQLKPLSEERQRRFFLETTDFLESRGYRQYEVANFARQPLLVCRHNYKYWRHQPYLGLGPGAHSFNGRTRRWLIRDLASYCQSLAAGQLPVAGTEELTPAQLRLEAVMLRLRLREGLPAALLPPAAQALLPALQQQGLLSYTGDRLYLTREGLAVADSLAVLLSG